MNYYKTIEHLNKGMHITSFDVFINNKWISYNEYLDKHADKYSAVDLEYRLEESN